MHKRKLILMRTVQTHNPSFSFLPVKATEGHAERPAQENQLPRYICRW